MKKLFICLSVIGLLLVSCSNDYDDSALWDSVNGLENRVAKLEELCKQMNTNISSLQEIVKALKERESITNVSTLSDGSGYSITFTSGKTITIYHGKNGSDGSDGTNGVTPTISVKQDGDGIYYWTVNGNWLIVDGSKVKAIGTDGADGSDGNDGSDGTDGKDGITPKFKIDGGYWYISYDNEQNWEQLGKATGDSGLNGENGDAFFKGVSIADGFVIFTLNDAESTEIKIPFYSETELTVHVTEPGTLKSLLTDEQMRTVISLKVTGNINDDDIGTIDASMLVVENIDLSDTDITALPSRAFCGGELFYGKQSLKRIILPQTCVNIQYGTFFGCRNLKTVIAPAVNMIGSQAFYHCENLSLLIIKDLTNLGLGDKAFNGCPPITLQFSESTTSITELKETYNKIPIQTLILPKTVTKIDHKTFYMCSIENIIFEEPSSLETIGVPNQGGYTYMGAFLNTQIQILTIPSSVTNIEYNAFAHCESLKEIIIPKGALKKIGETAFSNCSHLEKIVCSLETPPALGTNTFQNVPETCKLFVPANSLTAYRNAIGWKDFKTILPIPE